MSNIQKIERIRFIKLGSQRDGNEDKCLKEGLMVLGYHGLDHSKSINDLKEQIIQEYKTDKGAATRHAKQIKNFYDDSETTLWITFAQRKVWWGFADKSAKPEKDADGFTYRKMKDGWHDKDLNEKLLTFENVSGALLSVQGFRGTICDIKTKDNSFDLEEYTKRLIDGKKLEQVERAEENIAQMQESISDLVKMLHPKDFEYIVDLIFQYSGWKKLTPGAGVEKFIDLDLLMPLTNERAFVQIKSATSQQEYTKYEEEYYKHDIYTRMFFVYHSSTDKIKSINTSKPIHLMGISEISKLIIELGLITVLMKKVS